MVSVITPFRGNIPLSLRWRSAYIRETASPNTLIAGVNNETDLAMVQELGAAEADIEMTTVFEGTDEAERVAHISAIMKELITDCEEGLIVLWDDDIVPPVNGIQKLRKGLSLCDQTVAGVVSVQPFETAQDTAMLGFQPYTSAVAMSVVPESGLHQVWSGGTAFSIWRSWALKKTLPWGPVVMGGTVYGWDRELAMKLEALNLKTMAECSIRCRHDKITP